jgi:hypothetical protein
MTSLIIFLLAGIFYVRNRKLQQIKKRQQQGLFYVSQIKKVIALVQQHRGLTAAWLNGEKALENKLMMLKNQVAREKSELSNKDVIENDRWVGFCDHWQRLLRLNNTITVANSFEQHTKMIRNLAYFLEDTAEQYHLTADFLVTLPNIGFVWRELVLATENIGQSRALGSGIAAQKKCSSVEKIRLNFLVQNMLQVTDNILHQLSSLSDYTHDHNRMTEVANSKMRELITTIENELINANSINIEPGEYFNLASNTMSQLNDIFDHQVKQVSVVL